MTDKSEVPGSITQPLAGADQDGPPRGTVTSELFSIGTELTIGRIQDTNSSWMAARLTELGIENRRMTVLSDDLNAIVGALQASLDRRPDIVVITGGLGPTPDDRTVEALCVLTGRTSEIYESLVEEYMERRKISRAEVSAGLLKMATAPAGANVQPNPAGWAPCIRLDIPPTSLFALPGPPKEVEAVFTTHVAPYVSAGLTRRTSSLRLVVDMFESEVSPLMEEVMAGHVEVYLKAYVALRTGSSDGMPVDIVASGPDAATALARLRDAESHFARLVRAAGKSVRNA